MIFRIRLFGERKPWRRSGLERIAAEIGRFELSQPQRDQFANGMHIEPFVRGGIVGQVRVGQFEQRGGGPKAVLLKMHKRSCKLNQAFVERVIRPGTLRKPKFFEHVMRFKKQSPVEAFEIAQIMRVQFPVTKTVNQVRDGDAFPAHKINVESAIR